MHKKTSIYKELPSCFNTIEFKDKKPDVSLNLRSYMTRYRLYNYCVYIYLITDNELCSK